MSHHAASWRVGGEEWGVRPHSEPILLLFPRAGSSLSFSGMLLAEGMGERNSLKPGHSPAAASLVPQYV